LHLKRLPTLITSVAEPGCLFWSPDPNFFHPGSEFFPFRIRIFSIPDPHQKHLSILIQKWFLSSRKYDPGCSSRIRIPNLDPDFLPIPDPGS
jgi:hypothetical protein